MLMLSIVRRLIWRCLSTSIPHEESGLYAKGYALRALQGNRLFKITIKGSETRSEYLRHRNHFFVWHNIQCIILLLSFLMTRSPPPPVITSTLTILVDRFNNSSPSYISKTYASTPCRTLFYQDATPSLYGAGNNNALQ